MKDLCWNKWIGLACVQWPRKLLFLSSVEIIKNIYVGVRETTDQILSQLHWVTPLPSAQQNPRVLRLFHIN